MIKKLIIFCLLVLISTLSYFLLKEFATSHTLVTVVRVIDGDTFRLANGKTVRLIGIDAPEKGQYYYEEAREKLKELIEGKKVVLEADISNSDKLNRLLRYVFVNNLFVNLELVKEGYANVYIVSPNEKYSSELLKAEEYARKNKLGLWNKFSEFSKCIKVENFHFNAKGDDKKNLNDEYIVFKNVCNFEINLSQWTIKNRASKQYVFPNVSLKPEERVTLFSGFGRNFKNRLYWNSSIPIWNNKGDTLYLRDKDGSLVLIRSF